MINITENNLIIKIPCPNEAPLERLANIQIGLVNLISLLDHTDGPKEQIADGLYHLGELLKQMLLTSEQLANVNEFANKEASLMKSFIYQ